MAKQDFVYYCWQWLAVTLKWLLHLLWISHHYETFTECRNEDSVAEIDTNSIFMIWGHNLLLEIYSSIMFRQWQWKLDNLQGAGKMGLMGDTLENSVLVHLLLLLVMDNFATFLYFAFLSSLADMIHLLGMEIPTSNRRRTSTFRH